MPDREAMPDREEDFTITFGMLLTLCARVVAYLLEDIEQRDHIPHYRAPIAYRQQTWSLDTVGWSDSECLVYLRFSLIEIQSLIEEFCLAGCFLPVTIVDCCACGICDHSKADSDESDILIH